MAPSLPWASRALATVGVQRRRKRPKQPQNTANEPDVSTSAATVADGADVAPAELREPENSPPEPRPLGLSPARVLVTNLPIDADEEALAGLCRQALTDAGRDNDDVVGVRVLRLSGHSAQTGVVFLRNGTNAEEIGASISGASLGDLTVTTAVLADAADDERLSRAVMTLVRRVQTEADSAWDAMAHGRRGVGEGPRLAADLPRRA